MNQIQMSSIIKVNYLILVDDEGYLIDSEGNYLED
jgi:hypothetical protein